MHPRDKQSDAWSEWLLHDRHGGDPAHEQLVRAEVDRFADRVLDAAKLAPGMILADIGTGDGAIAFRAIERIGPTLQVILADISAPLLRHAQSVASQSQVQDQCTFLECSAERLEGIHEACVDVVTTRAVLAYVHDKCAALREFHRILKPGGRISIAEPILQEDAFNAIALKRLLDSQSGSHDPVLTLIHRWKAAQFPDTPEKLAASPIANYSERDLLEFVQECGFVDIHLELHVDVRRYPGMSWDTFVKSSPHPWAPTLGVILQEQFTPEERLRLERALRPAVEAGPSAATDRVVYLSASKPLA
jgi:arsenite methyltransferase